MNGKKTPNIDSLGESIISEKLSKISTDLIEVGIDSFLEDGLLKDIPIVGSFIGLTKVGIGIRDKIFAKKILKFLFEIKDIPSKKRLEFINKINSESNYSEKVGESILVIIDKIDNIRKAEFIGKLFGYSVNGTINYETFIRLSIIIEKCFLPDLSKLWLFYNGKQKQIEEFDKHQLYNLGLLRNLGVEGTNNSINGQKPRQEFEFKISKYGSLIVELLLIGNIQAN